MELKPVDVPYFKKELKHLSLTLTNRTPDELYRYLIKLSEVIRPITPKEEYFSPDI